jgi:phosphatidylinositol alpha-1,6-mannosyltransferase
MGAVGEAVRDVWYVTRKYPPSVGGMQRLAYQIATALRAGHSVEVIAWPRSQLGLPFFMAHAAMRILWGRSRGRISVLYLGDPMLAVLGALVRGAGIPVLVTVHGLDILYPNRAYQAYLRRFFWGRCDLYVAISERVAQLLESRGVARSGIEVAPPGIDMTATPPPSRSTDSGGPRLLSLGRLVPRKGVAWFVEAVAPRFFARFPEASLIIAGEGPEQRRIVAAARRLGISSHLELRGPVDEATKTRLLATCDAVIMPNVPKAGDMEGFGLVALEAGAAGKPVFAADIDGLGEAVRDGENGWRLPAGDADAWTEALLSAFADPGALRDAGERAYRSVREHYAWTHAGQRYARIVDRFT